MCRSRWWFLEARVDGGMWATLFPARFAGAEYGCSLLDWLSRLMSSYEFCKTKCLRRPPVSWNVQTENMQKAANWGEQDRAWKSMTVTGYDTCIQFSSVHFCVTRYFTLPVLIGHVIGCRHWSQLELLQSRWGLAQARAALQPADGLLQIWERCKCGKYTMCSDHDRWRKIAENTE